ncbi:MAG: hypothetical protein HC906_12340 [Bacteroidales bacterium]|nr:hypothetical protein [Bacteroidales bacterium]
MQNSPVSITEIVAFRNSETLDRSKWRASNLFPAASQKIARKAWKSNIIIDEMFKNSYLVVAVPGKYGRENAWAALKINNVFIGASDRAPSFECNHWEHIVTQAEGNYSYYFPVDSSYINQEIEVFVLGYDNNMDEVKPEVWITAYPAPFDEKILIIE